MPAKSPLLNNSVHFAFTASIAAFWANPGVASPANKAIASAILRMIRSLCVFDFKRPVGSRYVPGETVPHIDSGSLLQLEQAPSAEARAADHGVCAGHAIQFVPFRSEADRARAV